MGQSGCSIDFFVRGIQLSVPDVFHNGSGKQVGILKYDSQRMTEICLLDLVDVDSVVADLTVLHIIETVDQVCNRGFTCTGRTYEGNLLPRLCVKGQIMEYHMIIGISERHIKESNVTF